MKRRAGGFTLLEMSIALVLIGMALAIGFAALRLAARSMEGTDRLVNELEDMRIARAVVQRHVTQALPLRESSREREVDFQGESGQLEFIAPAPTQGGRMMGLYRYRLRFAAQAQLQELVLDYQPYAPGAAHDWSNPTESLPLLNNIKAGEFAYFGTAQGEEEAWLAGWSHVERLPRLVRIAMIRGEGQIPLELVVAMPVERGR